MTVAILALLGGCATLNPYEPAQERPSSGSGPGVAAGDSAAAASDPPAPDVVTPPPVAARPAGPSAHLLAEARRLSARGEFDRASAQVERALRIEPSSPWLYLALADIRLAQRDFEQAAVLVQKARSLSRGDPQVSAQADALALRNPAPPGPP